MTTRHVVADDTLGKVSRKLWELQRRVMEGTLDPNKVLASVQQFIEGHSLPIEQLPYQVSDQVYQLKIPPRKDLKSRAGWQIPVVDSYFFVAEPIKGSRNSGVRLARFLEARRMEEVRVILRNAGETPADPWELVAFAEQSHLTDVAPKQSTCIWSVVQAGHDVFKDSKPPESYPAYLKLFENYEQNLSGKPRGWRFEFEHEWAGRGNEGEWCKVNKGDYVLLRRKPE